MFGLGAGQPPGRSPAATDLLWSVQVGLTQRPLTKPGTRSLQVRHRTWGSSGPARHGTPSAGFLWQITVENDLCNQALGNAVAY